MGLLCLVFGMALVALLYAKNLAFYSVIDSLIAPGTWNGLLVSIGIEFVACKFCNNNCATPTAIKNILLSVSHSCVSFMAAKVTNLEKLFDALLLPNKQH